MISILIPIYNGIEFIDESVSSVINQSYENWELLIGINGHPQDSDVYQIAKKYEEKNNKISVFDFHTIRGKSNTLNEMIKHCSHDYIALLDVDDVWHIKKLEYQVKFLNNYDVVGSKCILFGDRNDIVPNVPQNDFSKHDFTLCNPIINSSVIIRKDLCYWRNELDGVVEDYDLWIRLWKLKKRFYNCPEKLVKHRIHKESAFNSKDNHSKVSDMLLSHGFTVPEPIKPTENYYINNIQRPSMENNQNRWFIQFNKQGTRNNHTRRRMMMARPHYANHTINRRSMLNVRPHHSNHTRRRMFDVRSYHANRTRRRMFINR
jgi:glycosyltransferase involved in cell wall biosynthesis